MSQTAIAGRILKMLIKSNFETYNAVETIIQRIVSEIENFKFEAKQLWEGIAKRYCNPYD